MHSGKEGKMNHAQLIKKGFLGKVAFQLRLLRKSRNWAIMVKGGR